MVAKDILGINAWVDCDWKVIRIWISKTIFALFAFFAIQTFDLFAFFAIQSSASIRLTMVRAIDSGDDVSSIAILRSACEYKWSRSL